MKNNISEDDAKEIIRILSKTCKFIVCSKREFVEDMIGDEIVQTSDVWTVSLTWSEEIAKKWSDTLYVSSLPQNGKKKEKNHYRLDIKGLTRESAYVQAVKFLSGTVLEKYDNQKDKFIEVCGIPEFSSLNELKMNYAIKGIDFN